MADCKFLEERVYRWFKAPMVLMKLDSSWEQKAVSFKNAWSRNHMIKIFDISYSRIKKLLGVVKPWASWPISRTRDSTKKSWISSTSICFKDNPQDKSSQITYSVQSLQSTRFTPRSLQDSAQPTKSTMVQFWAAQPLHSTRDCWWHGRSWFPKRAIIWNSYIIDDTVP